MDVISIDTSVFIENNYLEGKQLIGILELAREGYLKIVLPEIIVDELKKNIKEHVENQIRTYNSTRNNIRVLRNLKMFEPVFSIEKIDHEFANKCIAELQGKLDETFKSCGDNLSIIEYGNINVSSIFKDYFNSNPPFENIKDKKSEFPDAFILKMLEMWCEENSSNCIILSTDKGVTKYKSNKLISKNYKDYLSEKLIEKQKEERISFALSFVNTEKEKLADEIKDAIYNIISDEYNYGAIIYTDVHSMDIESLDVKVIDARVLSSNDLGVEIECVVEVSFEVNIVVDDPDNAIYDSEDKRMIYFDVTTEHVDFDKDISVIVNVVIPFAGEDYAEIEIKEINGGKDLI